MAAGNQDEVTLGTLESLELRLRRLEMMITGTSGEDTRESAKGAVKGNTAAARLEQLEDALGKLSDKHRVVADLLRLYNTHPDIFPSHPSSDTANNASPFTPTEQLATVLSCATSYSTTASQLTSVQDSPIPTAESSAALISLQPRLAKVQQRQAKQNQRLGVLRLRAAAVLQRWYELGVLSSGECWAEWDGRLMEVEKRVRRTENAREIEHGPV